MLEGIAQQLRGQTAQRERFLFRELNPNLVGTPHFESRWTTKRRPAAVLLPLIERPNGWQILLTVRTKSMPSHPGQISFPGGRVHADDPTHIYTALRETEEEIGAPQSAVEVLGTLGLHHGGLGFSVTPVVGVVASDAPLVACTREVDQIFEVPLDFVRDLNNHDTECHELEGEQYTMHVMPYAQFHVWGLTAGILRSFAEALRLA